MTLHYLNDVVNDGEATQKIDHYVIFASLKSKLINRIPGWRLLISSLPGSALIERTFQRECSPYLACNDRNAFFTSEKPKKNHAWSCQVYEIR